MAKEGRQNDIGDIYGIDRRGVELNTGAGAGAHDPMRAGKKDPGGYHPGQDGNKDTPLAVPMPKKRMID